ncbi:MAG: ATP-binding cassette domain-containing protein [Gammaproteobacteria bacterium]|jgi:sodium transport system ATP-binding protein|nr:ATP-binding cassette domain-containing protein [Gammaproteobacteria bacterium]
MIEVQNLTKSFKDLVAVDGVGFHARNGAITGLLGHNGAGKSTTLRILYGLLKADKGRAMVDGIDVMTEPLKAQAEIGVMTDAHGLNPRLTAREHIEYFARLRKMEKTEIQRRIDELIVTLDMSEIADRRAEGFSQGEKMKVCLSRSLVHDPQNLIMDEPTNGLDVMTTRSVRSILHKLKKDNKCILLSSHIMQEISALCDEIIVIADGKVLMQGTLDELARRTNESDLEEAFMKITRQG